MVILEDILWILKTGIELGLVWALLGLGVFISFRILDFADLTAEGTITFGAAIAASTIVSTGNFFLGVLLAVVGGFLAGVITGVLHTKLKIPPILSGIIMLTALYTINIYALTKKASISLPKDADTVFSFLRTIINDPFISKALTSFLILAIVMALMYVLFGTEVGIGLRATGMNQKMAKVQGINTDLMIIFGLGLSNAIIALGGSLLAQSNRSANLDLGRGTIVIGLASIIIGETLFGKRTFKNWLFSVTFGSIIFQLLIAIATYFDIEPDLLKLMQAILIAIILGMPVIIAQIKKKRERRYAET